MKHAGQPSQLGLYLHLLAQGLPIRSHELWHMGGGWGEGGGRGDGGGSGGNGGDCGGGGAGGTAGGRRSAHHCRSCMRVIGDDFSIFSLSCPWRSPRIPPTSFEFPFNAQ